MFTEVIPLDYEHDECIKLFMFIDDSQQVAGVSLSKNLPRLVKEVQEASAYPEHVF